MAPTFPGYQVSNNRRPKKRNKRSKSQRARRIREKLANPSYFLGSIPAISPIVNTTIKSPGVLQVQGATAPHPSSSESTGAICSSSDKSSYFSGSVPAISPVVNTTTKSGVLQLQGTTAPHPTSSLILSPRTAKHPAPFPKSPHYLDTMGKTLPPRPSLKGCKNKSGIALLWNMCLFSNHANISSYELFAYQETEGPIDASLWKKVGDIKALPLPMACTLADFVDNKHYYFTIRAVDVYQRFGPFSDPISFFFQKEGDSGSKK